MNVQQVTGLHEHTVRNVGNVALPQRASRKAPRFEVTYVRVHPRVWKTALRLADGAPERLEVLSPTQVLVHNGTHR
jgi:hypothetical protein